MNRVAPIVCCVLLGLVHSVWADDAAGSSNPYVGIVQRNVFALVPIPTNNPADVASPPDPPIKITPNGIMNVFGQLEALFKVTVPAQGKEAAHDQSYVLAEGERQDDIEVAKIDSDAAVITFINHGIKQELPLTDAPKITSGPYNAGGGAPPLNHPSNGVPPPNSPGGFRVRSQGDAPNNYNNPNNNAGGNNGGGGNSLSANNANAPQNQLSPEDQVISMEQQRAKWLDEGNPAAVIIPPTKLGQKLLGGDEDSGASGGPPVP